MQDVKSQRYQVIPLTIDQATPANTPVSNDETLDRGYSMITGIAIVVTEDAGLGENLLVGAKTQRQVWVDPIPVQLWNPDGAPIDLKFLSTNIPYGSGDNFFIDAVPLAALVNTDAQLYMVVRLEQNFTELPRK